MNKDYAMEIKTNFSWKGDTLHTKTEQFFKEHGKQTDKMILEHFDTDMSEIRDYLNIKRNGGYLFLCCEENYNRLACEEGAVNEIEIKRNIEEAFNWFVSRLKYVDENECAMFDEEDEVYRYYKNNPEHALNQFYRELENLKETRAIVFFNKQDNYECYYEIVVRKINVF